MPSIRNLFPLLNTCSNDVPLFRLAEEDRCSTHSVSGRGDPIKSVFAEKIRFHFISTTICAPVFTIIFVAVLIHARHVLIINKRGICNTTQHMMIMLNGNKLHSKIPSSSFIIFHIFSLHRPLPTPEPTSHCG